MAQTSDAHEPDLAHALTEPRRSSLSKIGSKIKLVITRSIFWAYERGTWQYDLIVIAILAFIFFSPRAWFNDRPTFQLSDLRHQQGIIEISRVNKTVHYLVDARLVESLDMSPEDAIPIILRQHVSRPFTVKSIIPVWDRNHQVILGYNVEVEEQIGRSRGTIP
jgi:hypothetical protein